jgi:hypothetical protein
MSKTEALPAKGSLVIFKYELKSLDALMMNPRPRKWVHALIMTDTCDCDVFDAPAGTHMGQHVHALVLGIAVMLHTRFQSYEFRWEYV